MQSTKISIMAALLIALAFVFKILLPKNLPWRIPGGWPLGSHWYRLDTVAFWILFGAGIVMILTLTARILLRNV